jgi:hypothetical protein
MGEMEGGAPLVVADGRVRSNCAASALREEEPRPRMLRRAPAHGQHFSPREDSPAAGPAISTRADQRLSGCRSQTNSGAAP